MIRFVRILGVLLMAVGGVVILSWFVKPLRSIWPVFFQWLKSLPLAIQIGLCMAAIGFLLLMASLIWERVEDRAREKNLLDDD